MKSQQREDARTDKMLVATKQAIEATVVYSEVDKLPAQSRERLGEIRALVGVSDLTRLAAIKLIQELKQECLERRVNWEQVCEESLPKCRRSIDHYLDTLETFGDGLYEPILDITTRAERVQARRMLRSGQLRLDGDCLVIGGRKVRNTPEEAHTILEIIRESMAREEAAKEEATKARAALKAQQEGAQKHFVALKEALAASQQQVRALSQLTPPDDLATDADRDSWRAARQTLADCDVRVAALASLAADPARTDVLRARVMGHLRTLQGWIQAAVDEIAEQMPPEWAPTIEAEEADCAIAPAMPPEMIEDLRQRTRAKGGLALVSAGHHNGHSADPQPEHAQ